VPNARDAAGSPAGAHLAVLVADTLSVVRVRRGSIGEPVVKIPVEWTDEFVMLRWASATEVAQWNRTIPALPEPVVLVEAPASPPDVR
jgi:phage terminase large subunit GpA-like protein